MADIRSVTSDDSKLIPPADVADTAVWRMAQVRRSLPVGVADTMADDAQRLLERVATDLSARRKRRGCASGPDITPCRGSDDIADSRGETGASLSGR